MPTQPCIEFPADTLGSDGDAAQDLKNRVIYFPKANGTWANATAYAFQGPVGPGLLTGSGVPSNALGSPSNGYADLGPAGLTYVKNSQNAWVPTGQIVGAQGIAGPSGQSVPSLNAQSYVYSGVAANSAGLVLSGSQQILPAAGGTQPWQFIPVVATTFAGATFTLSSTNSPGATTFRLVDQTAGTQVYSYTVSAGGMVINQTASVPLTTGNTHAWTVTGSGTAFMQASPVFLQPASTGISTPYAPLFATNFSAAPTSATPMSIIGSNGITQYMGAIKTAFLYSAQFTSNMSAACTVGLYNSASTLLYQASVPANQNTPLVLGPFNVNQYLLTAGNYTWRVTSSVGGYVSVLPQICL